jgi:alkanesulfonate monooxygenase SsuD/methylene tetrahydromethanopterin reductase-like flavin-dependent oxidoreductase (luciferase family)
MRGSAVSSSRAAPYADRMRFGISVPPYTLAATVVDWAAMAEDAGWDGVFVWDHLQWDGRVATLDPWVLLGAMAARTERVRLGTMVTPLSRRRPQVVAKHLVTLDHLSDGRAVLAVGLGEPPDRDFSDLGDESDPRTRAAMLDEALDVVDGLMRGPVSHHGTHYDVDAHFRPLPVQRPRPPIWVAGVAPHRRPLDRARRWDGFVPIGSGAYCTPEELSGYLASDGRPTREGWDVVAHWGDGAIPAQEYADAGATWLVRSEWPQAEGWQRRLTDIITAGPIVR